VPTFAYSAVDKAGRETSGQIEARDREHAHFRLGEQGLQAFSLEVLKAGKQRAAATPPAKAAGQAQTAASKKSGQRLKAKQLLDFTEEISDLLTADLPLEPALQSMETRVSQPQVLAVVSLIRAKVRDGMSLSNALRQSSPSFSDLYCNLVAAGEESGALAAALKQQQRYLSMMSELRGKIASAMVYPAFLIVSSLGVTVLFLVFLLPKLASLMQATGSQPPLAAVILLKVSAFLQHQGWLLALAAVILPAVGAMWAKLPANRRTWDALKLRLPLVRGMVLARFHVQFLETLSTVMRNGLPLVKGMDLAAAATPNLVLREKLASAREEVADGTSLSRALERTGVFPSLLADLVRVGERTGRMAEALGKASQRFDKQLTKQIDRMSSLIQPVTIVLMALLVGSMAYIMISVIYDTISLLRSR
jgi:type II secretory pathway component PulF